MNPKTTRNAASDDTPLVTVGQGDYERSVRPSDLVDPDDPPRPGEGGSLALVVPIFVFILGFVMGAILW